MEHRGLLLQVFEMYEFLASITGFMYQAQAVLILLTTGASEKDSYMQKNRRMYASRCPDLSQLLPVVT